MTAEEETVIRFDDAGLVPAVVQDVDTNEVLLLAWMTRESLDRTEASRRATFWSRSRGELWEKGLTSGNWLEVMSIDKNCEANSLLLKVRTHGPACHTGNHSCYYRAFDAAADLPAG